MVEPSPMPALEPRGSDETYRPLSGLALAGLILSAIFTLLILVYGVVGLLGRSPVLLSPWLLLLPAAGMALSFLARQQIRRSEGTRAGMRLALLGMWLGVLFGLGYTAYFIATHFSIRSQAQAFLVDSRDGFFTRLKSRERFNEAFLLSLPPEMRDNSVSAQDDARVERHYRRYLMPFRERMLVRVVHQGGPEGEIAVEDITESDHDQQGWFVRLNVRIKTPYEELPATVVVRRKDLSSGEMEWYVDMTQTREDPYRGRMTALGGKLMALRVWSHDFAGNWIDKLKEGKLDDALQDACNPQDFAPEGKGFAAGGKGILLDKISNKQVQQQIGELFQPRATRSDKQMPRFDLKFGCCVADKDKQEQLPMLAEWEIDPKTKHLRVTHEIYMMVVDMTRKPPRIICPARLVVESKGPISLNAERSRSPDWCIVSLEFLGAREHTPQAGGQGGPPGGAGP